MMNSHLIYRMALMNACSVALLVWAFQRGYVTDVIKLDPSGICLAIMVLLCAGLFFTTARALKISRMLNALKRGETVNVSGIKILAKQAYIADMSTLCEKLGMFGTVVGFLIAFAGIDPTADPKAIMAHILIGLSVAFMTTAVGFVAGTWLGINARLLHTATVCLIEDAAHADQR